MHTFSSRVMLRSREIRDRVVGTIRVKDACNSRSLTHNSRVPRVGCSREREDLSARAAHRSPEEEHFRIFIDLPGEG